jgi:hypothetical protein
MLSIVAMIFLSMLILNVHSSTSDKLIILYSNESVIEATGIVQAMFEEIQTKAFDEATTTAAAKERDMLTPVFSLGYDAGEVTYSDFDDIDDYDYYSLTDSANVMGTFKLWVLVNYAEETAPYDSTDEKTFMKRVDISITNASLPTLDEDKPYTLFFNKLISY